MLEDRERQLNQKIKTLTSKLKGEQDEVRSIEQFSFNNRILLKTCFYGLLFASCDFKEATVLAYLKLTQIAEYLSQHNFIIVTVTK